MAAILLVLSFFSYTLIGADYIKIEEEIWVDTQPSDQLSNFLRGQKDCAERMIMTALLEKDWPLYEEIIQRITLLFKGYAQHDEKNLNGLDGVIAGGKFLDRLRVIHQRFLPSSKEKLDDLGALRTEIDDVIRSARMAPLIFSASTLKNAYLHEDTNHILLAIHNDSDHESDTYGCNFTASLFPGLGCALGQMKNILGLIKPTCLLMLSWAAPLPTVSVGNYKETFDATCNCYPALNHGICGLGSSEYHDTKTEICEYGLGCMSTQKCIASHAFTLPLLVGQDCRHFAARSRLITDTIEPQVYQSIKQEWKTLIHESETMAELKEALDTIKNEIAQEKTTYFHQR